MIVKEPVSAKCSRDDSLHLQSKLVSINMPTKITQRNAGFKQLRIFANLGIYILKQCWMACGATIFLICVIYLCYGSILALALFLFALTGMIYQLGDSLLYHPFQPPQSRLYVPLPSLFDLPSESISIRTTDGVKLHCFFIKQNPSIVNQVPTILYLHGNAGNIGHRLPNVKGFYQHCKCNVFLLEYRGYGHSEGSPSEEGLYLDAQAGLQFLLQNPYIDKSKIIVFGRSLGGAVAIDLVSRPRFGRHVFMLVVENTFTSIPEIGRQMLNCKLIQMMPDWAFKNHFNSLRKIKQVKRPCLFISGQADLLIPPGMMKLLYQVCGSQVKRIHSYEFGSHNETWQCDGYYHSLNLFIDDVMLVQQELNLWTTTGFGEEGEIY